MKLRSVVWMGAYATYTHSYRRYLYWKFIGWNVSNVSYAARCVCSRICGVAHFPIRIRNGDDFRYGQIVIRRWSFTIFRELWTKRWCVTRFGNRTIFQNKEFHAYGRMRMQSLRKRIATQVKMPVSSRTPIARIWIIGNRMGTQRMTFSFRGAHSNAHSSNKTINNISAWNRHIFDAVHTPHSWYSTHNFGEIFPRAKNVCSDLHTPLHRAFMISIPFRERSLFRSLPIECQSVVFAIW